MREYPDPKEFPAWEMFPITNPGRPSDFWLTGLAQFIDARVKPLAERIAALERDHPTQPPDPALAERLATIAAGDLWKHTGAKFNTMRKILLPFFQQAVRGGEANQGGGE